MKNLVPKRRFEEFKDSDPWEQRKLTDEVELYSGLTYSPEDIVNESGTFVLRSSNVKQGEIVDADNVYVKQEVVNSDNVELGDIIVVVRNGSRNLIGKHAQIKEQKANTVIGAFMTGLRSGQSNFINALLDTNIFKSEIDKNLGATINQITNGMFHQMYFMMPNPEEQERIGLFFNNLDNLITLHQRKLDKLKETKSAYLSEMFPKEGEFYPKRRFAGFTDPWEQRKLSELYNFSQGMQVAIDDQSSEKTPKSERFIRIVDVTQADEPERYIINETGKGHVDEDDIFFVRYGAVGTVGIGYKGTIANNLFKLKPKEKLVPSYMYQYFSSGEFNNKLLSMSASTSMPAINFTALNNLVVRYPSIKEQIQIGTFFQNLDNLITLHQRKLDKLQALKHAYLAEMFV